MSDKQLNIVAFDVPYPPDYGGVIDIFYRIKALATSGVKIHLHAFQYGREKSKILEQFCESVIYYQRKRNPVFALSNNPFIVESRHDVKLLQNLQSNSYPILFEGLHTTYFLPHPNLRKRLKLVRTHNIEHEYYRNLSLSERKPWKKYFFKQEARKLEKYEDVLESADHILTISTTDETYFSKKYGKTIRINPFHPIDKVSISNPRQKYAFYHGNLTVPENIEALRFLVNEVFSQIDFPCVVAGKDAHKALAKIPGLNPNIQCFTNPDDGQMYELANQAVLHILPTFQATGFKLKLLYSLYTAPFVVVNSQMVSGTDLAPFCELSDSASEMVGLIEKISGMQMDELKVANRLDFLKLHYSNDSNALKIKSLME